jgi:hypothetical protein
VHAWQWWVIGALIALLAGACYVAWVYFEIIIDFITGIAGGGH